MNITLGSWRSVGLCQPGLCRASRCAHLARSRTSSIALPADTRIANTIILTREATIWLVFVHHGWVLSNDSFHTSMAWKFHSASHFFSDFSSQFFDEVGCSFNTRAWYAVFGHMYNVQYNSHLCLL
jgi:hypothetical protein